MGVAPYLVVFSYHLLPLELHVLRRWIYVFCIILKLPVSKYFFFWFLSISRKHILYLSFQVNYSFPCLVTFWHGSHISFFFFLMLEQGEIGADRMFVNWVVELP